MDIFSVLSLIGGLALFLFGMSVMGDGLTKLSGGKLEQILEKLTSKKFAAVGLGAMVTAVIQSSSATTVMVVGFVNSGIMKLHQATGVIIGANIGTTMTSWLLSLTGIEGGNILVQMLKPSSFSPILAAIGIFLYMFTKSPKKKDIGTILLGFAVLMFGMDAMSAAVKPLAKVPEFTNVLLMFSNPVLGVLAGLVLTAVIQSSSASIGILQALCVTGAVRYSTAVPIILGQNIGTCITAVISCVGTSKNAKRAALVHLYYNLIATVVFMILFYTATAFIDFAFLETAATPVGIAIVHTAFNVFAAAILLPFTNGLVKLACITIKDDQVGESGAKEFQLLDPRFLEAPAFAMEQCRTLTRKMADISKESLYKAMKLLEQYDESLAKEVAELETMVDHYEDELGTYLVKLSSKNLSIDDSNSLSLLLHGIGDYERISDHALNVMECAQQMNERGLSFSEKAKEEIKVFSRAIHDIVEMSYQAFGQEDIEMAKKVEPLEELVDELNDELKQRHVRRLREGKCTIELGFILSDLTTNYERIADHCSNLAVGVIQLAKESYERHEYLETLNKDSNEQFQQLYKKYKDTYVLPMSKAQ